MKNRCKAIVLSLVLATMIASGCGNNNLNPTPPAQPEIDYEKIASILNVPEEV